MNGKTAFRKKHEILTFILLCLIASLSIAAQKPTKLKDVTGEILRYKNFLSNVIETRNIDVWLPPGYDANNSARYPVVYMLDGQNLFSVKDSFGNAEWSVDETMTKLIAEKKIRPAIIVGVWSPTKRIIEYSPEKPFNIVVGRDEKMPKFVSRPEAESDKLLKFLTAELKPFIDRNYQTKPEAEQTFIVGSSMGALIALYAVGEYPQIFGGAGCLSTQYSFGDGVMIGYLEKYLPAPKTHKFYFDYGTKTLDKQIEPYQKEVDALLKNKNYEDGKNWITRKFPGEDHSEKSWSKRVGKPLMFLLEN